jgi:hypothetical protein
MRILRQNVEVKEKNMMNGRMKSYQAEKRE